MKKLVLKKIPNNSETKSNEVKSNEKYTIINNATMYSLGMKSVFDELTDPTCCAKYIIAYTINDMCVADIEDNANDIIDIIDNFKCDNYILFIINKSSDQIMVVNGKENIKLALTEV